MSGFVSFNNFAGMVAFGGAAPNRLNGIQITATGGDNLIRTCLVAGNLGNGIVIGGNATRRDGRRHRRRHQLGDRGGDPQPMAAES